MVIIKGLVFCDTITPNILLPFYTVLKRYILFWLISGCGSKPFWELKLQLFSNLEPIGVAYAPSFVVLDFRMNSTYRTVKYFVGLYDYVIKMNM